MVTSQAPNASGRSTAPVSSFLSLTAVEGLAVAALFAFASWHASGRLLPDLVTIPANTDVWFDADLPRVFSNMTDRTQGHWATFKHPLFSLLAWSPVTLLRALGLEPWAAVRALLVANAAAFGALLWAVLSFMGTRPPERMALCVLTAAAAGFQFWFGVPETFPFGATSILIALLPLAWLEAGRSVPWWGWSLASAISLTMTVTNWAVGVLATAAGLIGVSWREWTASRAVPAIVRLCLVLAAGVAGVAVLAIAQKVLFGGAGLFFNPFVQAGEVQYTGYYQMSGPAERLHGLFVAPITAGLADHVPFPTSQSPGEVTDGLRLDGRWPTSAGGVAAVILWLGLLASGLLGLARKRSRVGLAAMAFLVCEAVLHLVYGFMSFLYAAHVLAPLVLVASRGVRVLPRWVFLMAVTALAGLCFDLSIDAVQQAQGTALEVLSVRVP